MILKGLIYILQSEGYQPGRFLNYVYQHYQWWQLEKRKKLVWTFKALMIYALVMIILLFYIIMALFWKIWILAFLPLLIIALPVIIILVALIISPFDLLIKYLTVQKARKILAGFKNLKKIGITGSYGKTSTKEILAVILKTRFKVIKTPENINTPLGIARFIIKNKQALSASDIFLAEMGAYQRGDIADICHLVMPDYSVLTGINEAHLERFGSIENTISAKFELPKNTKILSVLNFNDKKVKNNYQHFKINNYKGVDSSAVSEIKELPDFTGLEFIYSGINFQIKLLARHNIELIILALTLAAELGINLVDAAKRLYSLNHIPHRLEPIINKQSGVVVIDDSYNGNLAGFKSGLQVLQRASGRKIIITPGLVELGKNKEIRHRELARLYQSNNLDLVILIKNSATQFIADEFAKIGYNKYKLYDNTQQAHADLANILQSGDTILFQNDWPDNYY